MRILVLMKKTQTFHLWRLKSFAFRITAGTTEETIVQIHLSHPNDVYKPALTASQPFWGCNQMRSRKNQISFLLVRPI